MGLSEQAPESDLWLPLPSDGRDIDPHTIHTHYFGFAVPEAELGGFIYIRYQPAFPLSQGGVCIFRGMGNVEILDVDYLDWQNTMRWPEVDGTTIRTAHGLTVNFIEPGRKVRITYDSPEASIDLLQTAITPLAARAHVMPGEAENAAPDSRPGGSEQFMHCTGSLRLRGEEFDIDCIYARDRSWNQVRTERRGAVQMPPIAWTPIGFDENLAFNQIGWEAPEGNPPFLEAYPVGPERPSHVYGWVHADGRTNGLAWVRREVQERHPLTHIATRQTIEAQDDEGRMFRFAGEAIAATIVPAWPNIALHDTVFRWEDDQGRVTHASCQEAWFDKYQHLMNRISPRSSVAGKAR